MQTTNGADRFRRWDRELNVRPELLRLVKQGTHRDANTDDLALAA